MGRVRDFFKLYFVFQNNFWDVIVTLFCEKVKYIKINLFKLKRSLENYLMYSVSSLMGSPLDGLNLITSTES